MTLAVQATLPLPLPAGCWSLAAMTDTCMPFEKQANNEAVVGRSRWLNSNPVFHLLRVKSTTWFKKPRERVDAGCGAFGKLAKVDRHWSRGKFSQDGKCTRTPPRGRFRNLRGAVGGSPRIKFRSFILVADWGLVITAPQALIITPANASSDSTPTRRASEERVSTCDISSLARRVRVPDL